MFAAALHLIGGTRAIVAGSSMEPSLLPGDRLLVSRLARCRPFSPGRGQIVLLRAVRGERPESLKRVAAVPGERVIINDGAVQIRTGSPRDAYRQADREGVVQKPETKRADRVWVLGPRDYFVVGDKRAFSTDSRQFGPVPREAIIGVAWYRYAPPERRGQVSMLPLMPRRHK